MVNFGAGASIMDAVSCDISEFSVGTVRTAIKHEPSGVHHVAVTSKGRSPLHAAAAKGYTGCVLSSCRQREAVASTADMTCETHFVTNIPPTPFTALSRPCSKQGPTSTQRISTESPLCILRARTATRRLFRPYSHTERVLR